MTDAERAYLEGRGWTETRYGWENIKLGVYETNDFVALAIERYKDAAVNDALEKAERGKMMEGTKYQMDKAMKCMYVAVTADVAHDIERKVRAHVEALEATIATLREAMAYVVDVGECLADDAQEALRSIVVNTTAALAETGNGEEG